jgi:hypothetical protein
MLTVTWKRKSAAPMTMAMQTIEMAKQFMVMVEAVAAYERGPCQGMVVGVGLGAATLEHC